MGLSTSKSSIFQNLNQPYLKTNKSFSYEMIDYQPNDIIIPALEKQYSEILFKLNNNLSSKDIFINLDKIDSIIKDRFGFTTKHCIKNDGNLIQTYSIPPQGLSTLINKNIKQQMNFIKDNIKENDNRSKLDKIETVEDYNKLLSDVIKSSDSLEQQLGKGIIINRKNAKILNLPNDYVVYIFIDTEELVDLNLKPKELVAILLHEVGHIFNDIEYSYTLVRNNFTFIDTFIDNVRNKNKNVKESLILSYSSVTGNQDFNMLKDKSSINVLLTILHDILKQAKFNFNKNTMFQVEKMADTFAGRFGLHKELVIALNKSNYNVSNIGKYLLLLINIFLILNIVILFLISTVFSFNLILILSFIYGVVSVLNYIIIFPDSDVLNLNIHGNDYDRVKSIRNDAIKQLRISNLNKTEIKNILVSIETIDLVIDSIPKPSIGPIQHVINFLFHGKQKEMQKIDEMLSSLSENELHISAAKLSTLS